MWLRVSLVVELTLSALAVQALAVSTLPACAPQARCTAAYSALAGQACAAACPRDARRDPSGRCACTDDTVLVLGACVPPAVGDAYCGPTEQMGKDGCSARPCAVSERLDVVTGRCIPLAALSGAPEACGPGSVALASAGHAVCAPFAATCPRGTHRDGLRCVRPVACPAGSLPEGASCRPIVSAASAPGRQPTVDVGAWVALVIGPAGGRGSDDLCSRLARRPEAFQVPRGEARTVALRVALDVPDEDLSRVSASVSEASAPLPKVDAGTAAAGPDGGANPQAAPASPASPANPWLPSATEVVEAAVGELLEPLRGLGGESSCAALEVVVACELHGA
jgi:hypothetical protein